MRKRHTRLFSWLSVLAVSICVMLIMAPAVYADTDGTELQVTDQPEKLVIQLGSAWAGVEFELKTDVGIYPQPIVVSPEGVLSMELGGSKTYTLSALQSSVPVPAPTGSAAEPETESSQTDPAEEIADVPEEVRQPESTDEPVRTDAPDDAKAPSDTESEGGLVKGIPNTHLFLFAGGLTVSVAGLVIMWVLKKRRNRQYDDDEDYYDEE